MIKSDNGKFCLDSKTPAYLQAAKYIKSMIENGSLPTGTKLSQRKIANMLGLGRKPVMEAFEILDAEGYIFSKHRSGTIVTNNIWLRLNENRASDWFTHRNSGRHKPSPLNIFNAFAKMDDEVTMKIDGDRIAPCFKPEMPIVSAFDKVAKRLRDTDELGFFGLKGLPSFRQALSEHMRRYGLDVGYENIITTSGIGESLAMIAYGFLNSGTNMFYEAPSFLNTIMLMQSTGANMNEVMMDDEGINFDKLIVKLRRSKNSVLYIQGVNHNPTGAHITKQRRDNILGACIDLGIPIIENDMFRDYSFDKSFARPFKAFDKNGQVLYIGSLMSCFMGFKVSWIAAPAVIIERLRDIRTHFELASNVVVEMIAEETLRSGAYYDYFNDLKPKTLAHYNKIMATLDKYLKSYATWRKDNPAYFIWLKFNEGINIPDIYSRLKEHLFFPGVIFDWSDTRHVRLNTLGVDTDKVDEWIKKIAESVR